MSEGPSTANSPAVYKLSGTAWSGHNLETFVGRVKYWNEIVSPEKSFYSTETIMQYAKEVDSLHKERLDAQGQAMLTPQEYADYRHKRLVLASSTSPDTGDVIPWAMRTCAFVPTNIPIIVGMLVSPPT